MARSQALRASLLSGFSWLSMTLDLAQMVLDVQKNHKPTQSYLLNNLCYNNLPRNQALEASLLTAYSWLSMALDLAQMVLDS